MIAELSSASSIKGSSITTLCIDDNLNYLYTGDMNGYITIWSYEKLVKRYNLNDKIDLNESYEFFNMIICWRAHMSKIVSLILSEETKLLFSASSDESVR